MRNEGYGEQGLRLFRTLFMHAIIHMVVAYKTVAARVFFDINASDQSAVFTSRARRRAARCAERSSPNVGREAEQDKRQRSHATTAKPDRAGNRPRDRGLTPAQSTITEKSDRLLRFRFHRGGTEPKRRLRRMKRGERGLSSRAGQAAAQSCDNCEA